MILENRQSLVVAVTLVFNVSVSFFNSLCFGAVYFLVFVGFGVGLVVVKFGCDCIDQGSDAGSNVGFVVGFNDDIGLNQCVICFVLINDFDGK